MLGYHLVVLLLLGSQDLVQVVLDFESSSLSLLRFRSLDFWE